jgi:hypothetical protein
MPLKAEIIFAESEGKTIFDKHQLFLYGACFAVPKFEKRYREHVVEHFGEFLTISKTKGYFEMLVKWRPDKAFPLVCDAWGKAQNRASENAVLAFMAEYLTVLERRCSKFRPTFGLRGSSSPSR